MTGITGRNADFTLYWAIYAAQTWEDARFIWRQKPTVSNPPELPDKRWIQHLNAAEIEQLTQRMYDAIRPLHTP